PEVALYLVEQEPNFLRQLEKQAGLELEMRDDPMMRLDEFRMMAKPAGRDVTEQYAVAWRNSKSQLRFRPHDVRDFLHRQPPIQGRAGRDHQAPAAPGGAREQ